MAIIDKKKLSRAVDETTHGTWLSARFFKKYLFQTVFVVALLMMYISNRYDCKTGMEEITRLSNSLDIAKTRMQEERAAYMSSIRESAMQQTVTDLGLGLEVRERPPYKLIYDL